MDDRDKLVVTALANVQLAISVSMSIQVVLLTTCARVHYSEAATVL
jgi:hypothetical protein